MNLIIINGPNLNLLGKREPSIYGDLSFENYLVHLKQSFPDVEIEYFQSNVEGELINKLHETGFTCDGIILNAGGYTHTSVAIGDAVKAIEVPVVEVHISNVMSREEFRHQSFISAGAKGVISGFGMDTYRLAVLSFLKEKRTPNHTN
jgi:3-dehydroquinate dehydratase II